MRESIQMKIFVFVENSEMKEDTPHHESTEHNASARPRFEKDRLRTPKETGHQNRVRNQRETFVAIRQNLSWQCAVMGDEGSRHMLPET